MTFDIHTSPRLHKASDMAMALPTEPAIAHCDWCGVAISGEQGMRGCDACTHPASFDTTFSEIGVNGLFLGDNASIWQKTDEQHAKCLFKIEGTGDAVPQAFDAACKVEFL